MGGGIGRSRSSVSRSDSVTSTHQSNRWGYTMPEEHTAQSSTKVIVITSLISAVATIMVSFIGIVPQLRRGDLDELARLKKQTDITSAPAPGERWTITGTVLKGENKPVSNAEVYLLPATGGENITATDDRGGFIFQNMPLRPYWIVTRDTSSGSSNRVLMDAENKEGEIRLTESLIKYHFSKQ